MIFYLVCLVFLLEIFQEPIEFRDSVLYIVSVIDYHTAQVIWNKLYRYIYKIIECSRHVLQKQNNIKRVVLLIKTNYRRKIIRYYFVHCIERLFFINDTVFLYVCIDMFISIIVYTYFQKRNSMF